MLVAVALGGAALMRRRDRADLTDRGARAEEAAAAIAAIARRHRVVVTWGNGPQAEVLALQGLDGPADVDQLDLSDVASETVLEHLLRRSLARHLPHERLVSVHTQVEVDPSDAAFTTPTAFVGAGYGFDEARHLARQRGWTVAFDGPGWRRVVARPRPVRIVEAATIELLVANQVVTLCPGGGGTPVAVDGNGDLQGVAAVVDQDLTAALLAAEIGADALLLLTDVDAIYADWDADRRRPLGETSVAELRSLDIAPATMGAKVEAACRFLASSGGLSAIGAVAAAPQILRRRAGTWLLG